MAYLADFVSGNAKKLRRDVFVSVSPLYVEQSHLANLNLFAEIPNDDGFSMIQHLIDCAVDDYVSMCAYANFALAFNGVGAALEQYKGSGFCTADFMAMLSMALIKLGSHNFSLLLMMVPVIGRLRSLTHLVQFPPK